ncbi:MAG: LamB/YcsF family protein [bacterium]|nr:LamB/YcsF family protein [bacterium]
MRSSQGVQLGCDTGEATDVPGRHREAHLLEFVQAVHIACGGHAGDAESMSESISLAKDQNCSIGAHPSYPDKEGFGRREILISRPELAESLRLQLSVFASIAADLDAPVLHVKPHGALYHRVSRDLELAICLGDLMNDLLPRAALVLPVGAPAISGLVDHRISVLKEAFCDRAYDSGGTLLPRSQSGSVIRDPMLAAEQAERLINDVGCDLLCVHSDTPNAVEIAKAVSERLGRVLGD